MEDNRGCYSVEKLLACSFMRHGIITLYGIIHSEIPTKDKFWFICKVLATKEENKQIAIRVAEIVLPIYEVRYPDSKGPRGCVEAARAFIAGTVNRGGLLGGRKSAADCAVAASYAADSAACAASYAADSAVAASYAADSAVAAAYAADSAACAAYAADSDNAYKSELHNYLLTFIGKI